MTDSFVPINSTLISLYYKLILDEKSGPITHSLRVDINSYKADKQEKTTRYLVAVFSWIKTSPKYVDQ